MNIDRLATSHDMFTTLCPPILEQIAGALCFEDIATLHGTNKTLWHYYKTDQLPGTRWVKVISSALSDMATNDTLLDALAHIDTAPATVRPVLLYMLATRRRGLARHASNPIHTAMNDSIDIARHALHVLRLDAPSLAITPWLVDLRIAEWYANCPLRSSRYEAYTREFVDRHRDMSSSEWSGALDAIFATCGAIASSIVWTLIKDGGRPFPRVSDRLAIGLARTVGLDRDIDAGITNIAEALQLRFGITYAQRHALLDPIIAGDIAAKMKGRNYPYKAHCAVWSGDDPAFITLTEDLHMQSFLPALRHSHNKWLRTFKCHAGAMRHDWLDHAYRFFQRLEPDVFGATAHIRAAVVSDKNLEVLPNTRAAVEADVQPGKSGAPIRLRDFGSMENFDGHIARFAKIHAQERKEADPATCQDARKLRQRTVVNCVKLYDLAVFEEAYLALLGPRFEAQLHAQFDALFEKIQSAPLRVQPLLMERLANGLTKEKNDAPYRRFETWRREVVEKFTKRDQPIAIVHSYVAEIQALLRTSDLPLSEARFNEIAALTQQVVDSTPSWSWGVLLSYMWQSSNRFDLSTFPANARTFLLSRSKRLISKKCLVPLTEAFLLNPASRSHHSETIFSRQLCKIAAVNFPMMPDQREGPLSKFDCFCNRMGILQSDRNAMREIILDGIADNIAPRDFLVKSVLRSRLREAGFDDADAFSYLLQETRGRAELIDYFKCDT